MIFLLALVVLLRVVEVATSLAVSTSTVRRLCASGLLRALRVGTPGSKRPTWRIPEEALEEFVEDGLRDRSPPLATTGLRRLDDLAAKARRG